MQHVLMALLFTFFIVSCSPAKRNRTNLFGTWQSLWQEDINLQLKLHENGRFRVTLTRTGQVHNNLGWFDIKGDEFLIRDSVDYPLPVCNISDTGRYKFRLYQDTLQFVKLEDKCERRSAALQLERFVRID